MTVASIMALKYCRWILAFIFQLTEIFKEIMKNSGHTICPMSFQHLYIQRWTLPENNTPRNKQPHSIEIFPFSSKLILFSFKIKEILAFLNIFNAIIEFGFYLFICIYAILENIYHLIYLLSIYQPYLIVTLA